MYKFLLLASVSLATFGTMPVYAAKISSTKPIYAWKTETEKDPATGNFNHCRIQDMYDNGTLVTFAENADGVQRLALSFPQGKLKRGQHADLTLQVDNQDVFPVEAVSASAQILTIGLPEGLLDEMRKGRVMHLRGPNDEVVYALGPIEGAVEALRDCLVTQKNQSGTPVPTQVARARPPAMPVPVQRAEPVPASPAMEPRSDDKPVADIAPQPAAPVEPVEPLKSPFMARVESLAAKLTNKPQTVADPSALPAPFDKIVADAGLAPTVLMPEDVAQNARQADYAWKTGNVTVAIKQLSISGDNVFTRDNVSYLAKLKANCDGQFVAEASEALPRMNDKPAYQLVETACSGKIGDTITAVLFAALPKGTAVFSAQAKADQGSDAIKARDAMARAVLQ